MYTHIYMYVVYLDVELATTIVLSSLVCVAEGLRPIF